MFTVQMSEEEFRILGPEGEEGCAVEYGEIATLAIGPAVYYCQVDDPEATDGIAVLCVQSVRPMPTETEEVEFEEADEAAGPALVQAETENDGAPEVVE
jgi:hypothetical protein